MRLLAHGPDRLGEQVDQRADLGHRRGVPGDHGVELTSGGDIGPAEHRAGDVGEAPVAMDLLKALGEGDRDGGEVHMHGAGPRVVQDTRAEDHLLDDRVFRQHREHDLGVERLRRACSPLGAFGQKGFDRPRRAVPHPQFLAALQEVGGHARTHVAEADEADGHGVRLSYPLSPADGLADDRCKSSYRRIRLPAKSTTHMAP